MPDTGFLPSAIENKAGVSEEQLNIIESMETMTQPELQEFFTKMLMAVIQGKIKISENNLIAVKLLASKVIPQAQASKSEEKGDPKEYLAELMKDNVTHFNELKELAQGFMKREMSITKSLNL